jgi:hypothetical protein
MLRKLSKKINAEHKINKTQKTKDYPILNNQYNKTQKRIKRRLSSLHFKLKILKNKTNKTKKW